MKDAPVPEKSRSEDTIFNFKGLGLSSEDTILATPEPKKLTWYDDDVNANKPFTLRTDESFGASPTAVVSLEDLFGHVMKEIRKYTNCGVEEYQAHASEQHET